MGSLSNQLVIRPVKTSDYLYFIPKLNHWWGERQISHLVQKYHFASFQSTSFTAIYDGALSGFLIGFEIDNSEPSTRGRQAYIHFVGVDPQLRGKGIGEKLYDTFFENIQKKGCRSVSCVTSPVNVGSIAFHRAMGFELEQSATQQNGIPVHINDDGHGGTHVRFLKTLI